jgi:hypothetical protein
MKKSDPFFVIGLKIDIIFTLRKLGLHNGEYQEMLDL